MRGKDPLNSHLLTRHKKSGIHEEDVRVDKGSECLAGFRPNPGRKHSISSSFSTRPPGFRRAADFSGDWSWAWLNFSVAASRVSEI